MMIRLIGCFLSLVLLSSLSFAQTGSLDLIPSIGEKGKTVDLTIRGTESVPPELPSVELELSKGSSLAVPINNYQQIDFRTATGTVTLNESLETGSYDFVIISGGREVGREEDAFRVINERSLTNITPSEGQKGKTIDLTIEGTGLPTGRPEVDLELSKGSSLAVPINNYQRSNPGSATGTVTLTESLDTGSYDFVITTSGRELFRKADAFQIVDKRSLTEVTPSEGGRDETLEVEISGQNTNFGPATQTNIIFTQGPTSNPNTASLQNITIINSSLLEGTLELAQSFDTDSYDVIYEKKGREILREEDLFTVLKFPSGRSAEQVQKQALDARIYPNPFQGSFNLKLDIPKAMRLRARVVNPSGKVIKQVFDQQLSAGEHEIQNLSLSPDLPSGIYLLKVEAQDSQFSTVIRIQKQ